jgi:hypothetical protein
VQGRSAHFFWLIVNWNLPGIWELGFGASGTVGFGTFGARHQSSARADANLLRHHFEKQRRVMSRFFLILGIEFCLGFGNWNLELLVLGTGVGTSRTGGLELGIWSFAAGFPGRRVAAPCLT